MRAPALTYLLALAIAWTLSLCSLAYSKGEEGTSDPWGKRIALVIGNSTYEGRIEPLKNPANDADAIAAALKTEHFEVNLLKNADLTTFKAAIAKLEKDAKASDVVLIYYSGHGFQLGGQNYLVPTDAVLDSRDAIESQTVRLDDIISQLDSPDHQTLILLDACRNNPLPAGVRGKDEGDGLAQVTRMVNTYVAFSTQPGNVSVDGTGSNSPFAKALVDNLDLAGKSISDVMVKVRGSVLEATNNLQQPFEQSTLTGYFYFNPVAQVGLTFGTGTTPGGLTIGGATQVAVGGPTPTTVVPDTPAPTTIPVDKPVNTDQPIPIVVASVPEGDVQVPGQERSVAAVEPPSYSMIDITDAQPSDAGGGTQVAELPSDTVTTPQLPDTTTTTPPIAPPPESNVPDDLPLAIQQQLKDIGCYTSTVDGDWGAGSRAALQRFYDAKKEQADSMDPTAAVYQRLQGEKGTVCEVQIAKQPVKPDKPDKPAVKPDKPVTKPDKPYTKPATTTTTTTTTDSGPKINMNKLGSGSGVFR